MKYFYRGKRRQDSYIALKEKYYQDLETMQEQYDIYLHDIRHTMRTIAALSEEGNCEEIGRLVKGLRMSLSNIEWKLICSNKILNALLVERKEYADDNGVILKVDVREPLYLQDIEDMDMITLIGNLLDNAIEADKKVKSREGVLCNIGMAREDRHILIQIENGYEEKQHGKKAVRERKPRIGEKHGLGCKSMQKIVRKYGGIIENDNANGRYRVKVVLPVQSGWNEEVPHEAQRGACGALGQ